MPTTRPHAATTLDRIERADEALSSAYATGSAAGRYLAASLAALRGAAALVAACPVPQRTRRGPHDVWALTALAAPELTEWAQRFAAVTGRRVGIETGLVRVSAREADDLLRDAETFVDLASRRIGVPATHPPRRLAPVRTA